MRSKRWKKIPARTRTFVAVAANVATVGSLLISLAKQNQSVSNVLIQAAPHIGLACIAGLGTGALALGGHWFFTEALNRLIPRRGFKGMMHDLDSLLQDEMGGTRGSFVPYIQDPYRFMKHTMRCEEMKLSLAKLGIVAPRVPEGMNDQESWVEFLVDMVRLARRGDLREARQWPFCT